MPNHLERRYLGNQRAALAARQREADDPWEQARRRVRELQGPPSAVLFVDLVAERHRKLGRKMREAPVFVGYGGCRRCGSVHCAHRGAREDRARNGGWPDEEKQGMAELAGRSRRTMIRGRQWVTEHGILRFRLGGNDGQPVHRRARRSNDGRPRWYFIGEGGCMKGGIGLANAYWPDGIPDPDPTPPERPRPPEPGQRPPEWAALKSSFDEHRVRAQRERLTQRQARAP